MDPHSVFAEKPLADEQTRVLKQGETFAVFDHYGNIKKDGLGEEGLYHAGTRFLSRYFIKLKEAPVMGLSSTTKQNNALLTVNLTNPDIGSGTPQHIPHGSVHIFRSIFLWNGCLYECVKFKNFAQSRFESRFLFHFDSDFADVFEVRGTKRKQKGKHLGQSTDNGRTSLSYLGLDDILRKVTITTHPAAEFIRPCEMEFIVQLAPEEEAEFLFTVMCESQSDRKQPPSYDEAFQLSENSFSNAIRSTTRLYTSHPQFNDWILRSEADLHMMMTETPFGAYPYAGVPWFSTAFGRDGIITALECLWLFPSMAKGVLKYLAATQATETNEERDAQPGKILHETRDGEMANLNEIPFGKYYGSVDSTPLFICLAGAYFERTGDLAFLGEIWDHIERALQWIEVYGDVDKDGFVEYSRRSSKGLVQQGWKDSEDSIFVSDGKLAEGPIALSEVQGYVFFAKSHASKLAAALGKSELAQKLQREAGDLQRAFETAFWCEDLQIYALALDGKKRPCRVRTSNAGQCLFSGIASQDHAERVATTLFKPDSFCGWGIRTVSALEKRYNPMSYHNGSIWPHDNALIAKGLSKYRLKSGVLQIIDGLFEASSFVNLHRMPELLCGFEKREGEGPTLYPVACSPQAWAAGAVFMLIEAALGLEILVRPKQRVILHYPDLPRFLNEILIERLKVGDGSIDLLLRRHQQDIGVNVLKREGDVEVVVLK